MATPKKAATPRKATKKVPQRDALLAAADSPVMGAKFPKAYTGKLLMLRKALKKGPRHG